LNQPLPISLLDLSVFEEALHAGQGEDDFSVMFEITKEKLD
jgi:hypothetical protein